MEEWRKLPPLVRASSAQYLAQLISLKACDLQDEAARQRELGMLRRAQVTDRFVRLQTALGQLFVDLAIVADDEAVERGIDTDLYPNLLERPLTTL